MWYKVKKEAFEIIIGKEENAGNQSLPAMKHSFRFIHRLLPVTEKVN